MTNPKQKSVGPDSITLLRDSSSYRIQKEVRRLLSFENLEQWEETLWKNGGSHKMYYHYTTLEALSKMLSSASWKMTKADKINDNYEAPVYVISFTTSSLSSTGMWKQYANWNDR